jgi:hypothetical protein
MQKNDTRQVWGLYVDFNTFIQQFVGNLNKHNFYLLFFPKEHPKQLDQDETIEILYQPKAT